MQFWRFTNPSTFSANASTNVPCEFEWDEIWWQIEDDEATTDTQTVTANTSIELPNDDGVALLTASFTSFNSDGWTQNFSAIAGSARKFPSLVIEEAPASVTLVEKPLLMSQAVRRAASY